ncbi:MAG: hypothetical protein QW520_02920 [Methanomassiliicoccales archaeon]
MRASVYLIVFFTFILVFSTLTSSTQGFNAAPIKTSMEGTITIAPGKFMILLHFTSSDEGMMTYSFFETKGRPLDIMLIDEKRYHALRAGANVTCMPGSTLNAPSAEVMLSGFEPSVQYYLLADNSVSPYGGAIPTEAVEISYRLELQGIQLIEKSQAPWAIPYMLSGMVVLIIVVSFFVIRHRSGKEINEPASTSLEMRYCPSCGAAMAMFEHECKRCGKRS